MAFIIVDDRRDTSASVDFERTAGVAVFCHAVCSVLSPFCPSYLCFFPSYLCLY